MITRRSFLAGLPVAAVALAWPTGATAHVQQATRSQQSPIALVTADAQPAPDLAEMCVDYHDDVEVLVRYVSRDLNDPSGCSTRGREETVEAEVPEGAAAIRLGDTRYDLVQFHFHTPSEHVLDGHRFPVEQHFVHSGPAGETLVIGLFLSADGPGGTLQDRVLERLPAECGDEVLVSGLDLASALPDDLTTLRYPGSLTTSPNTEGVSWLVLREPRALARETVVNFRELFPDGDARDLQPLCGRVVQLREQ